MPAMILYSFDLRNLINEEPMNMEAYSIEKLLYMYTLYQTNVNCAFLFQPLIEAHQVEIDRPCPETMFFFS